MGDAERVLHVADTDRAPSMKVCRPCGTNVSIVPVDDPQTMRGTSILLPDESEMDKQRRRKREMQGTQEPQEMRESKMRHSRVVAVGPDCKVAKVGMLMRWIGQPAAFYLNGEEVVLIREEQIICWIEEPNETAPVLQ